MASTNTERGQPGHEGRRENAPKKKMYFQDWFKVWLAVGFIWAGIKAAPLGLKGLWLLLAVVPLAYGGAWFMTLGKRRPKRPEQEDA